MTSNTSPNAVADPHYERPPRKRCMKSKVCKHCRRLRVKCSGVVPCDRCMTRGLFCEPSTKITPKLLDNGDDSASSTGYTDEVTQPLSGLPIANSPWQKPADVEQLTQPIRPLEIEEIEEISKHDLLKIMTSVTTPHALVQPTDLSVEACRTAVASNLRTIFDNNALYLGQHTAFAMVEGVVKFFEQIGVLCSLDEENRTLQVFLPQIEIGDGMSPCHAVEDGQTS